MSDESVFYINSNIPDACYYFNTYLGHVLEKKYDESYDHISILCIGTDRSTGDCLGPLVGQKLDMTRFKNVSVHGTLDEPVHAANLDEKVNEIYSRYEKPLVLAVDACLGKSERIGMITVGEGSLRPGAGVKKNLPEVGNIYVTGTVNIAGFMEYLTLQNTRLSLVMKIADIISNGIYYNLWKMFLKNNKQSNITSVLINKKS